MGEELYKFQVALVGGAECANLSPTPSLGSLV
jgi:hypothetical protein